MNKVSRYGKPVLWPGIENVVNRHNAAAAERGGGSPGSANTDEGKFVLCGITEKYRLSMSFDIHLVISRGGEPVVAYDLFQPTENKPVMMHP